MPAEKKVLDTRLATCVPNGFKEGRNEAMIQELSEVFELARK
jgi:DNA-binding FrmR family transcriptional regulator